MHANASHHATRDYERIAREILAEAESPIVKRRALRSKRGESSRLSLARRAAASLRGAKRHLDDRRAVEARPVRRLARSG